MNRTSSSPSNEGLDIQKRLIQDRASPVRKYRALVVGGGTLFMLKYELVVLGCSAVPGALGLALRKFFYPKLLGSCGRNVVFGTHVILRHPRKIHLGDNVVIDDHCLLDAKGESNTGIRIGSGAFIGRNTVLHCKNGDISIGLDANIGFNCDITSSGRVVIGDKVLIAAFTYLVGGGHEYSRVDIPVMDQARTALGIDVGDGAWLGAGVIVQDGVRVGRNAIVGAGAVVNRDVPENTIVAGVPARILRSRVEGAPSSDGGTD